MSEFAQSLVDLLTITYNGCIIHKVGNKIYRWATFEGTLQQCKDLIDTKKTITKIGEGVFCGIDHPLHPDNQNRNNPV